jgi:hypothetical protein
MVFIPWKKWGRRIRSYLTGLMTKGRVGHGAEEDVEMQKGTVGNDIREAPKRASKGDQHVDGLESDLGRTPEMTPSKGNREFLILTSELNG